ncbi:N-acetylmuramoyl-L-alanine amidase [Azoarcus olearius]|uniref:N-acetylmuramoyl-L-alanine amidase n=1 Tax=Azoarcus sp. (strain BH72) TaxID=418699 RepID=A1K6E1_AZOSB|nr:N-acetylmuramoyl-L-alanine amidase [Azoarcus olearius]ANQ84965.1 N-acetylmuramoyl-L-alanine amidase [Azoarcus olearius]CAL94396.1 N-acetylmuramoyl-L-alanine amidase [Azoarcus olearius]
MGDLSVANHRLAGKVKGKSIGFSASPNHNGIINPKFVVFHYTACSHADASAAFMNASGNRRVSAHLLVDSDGSITQFVDFNLRAWHAGVSEWEDYRDLNSHSIGVEIVNYGYLLKNSAGGFTLSNGRSSPFTPAEVVEARHRKEAVRHQYWHAFTPEQLETCEALVEVLFDAYALSDVLGHDDIAPTRKVDPGPAFPMDRIKSRAVGRDSDIEMVEAVYVAVPRLNIREGAGTGYRPVREPLTKHTRLVVIQRSGGWINVEVDGPGQVKGWVWGEYTRSSPLQGDG